MNDQTKEAISGKLITVVFPVLDRAEEVIDDLVQRAVKIRESNTFTPSPAQVERIARRLRHAADIVEQLRR